MEIFMDEDITLDNWKPIEKEERIIQSQWRKDRIGNDFNQQPGVDDLRKIKFHIKNKRTDYEIMKAFGVSAETLVAIKNNRYSPTDGIALDDKTKIYNEFLLVHKKFDEKILRLNKGLEYISKILFVDEEGIKEFKAYCKKAKNKTITDDDLSLEDEELQNMDERFQ